MTRVRHRLGAAAEDAVAAWLETAGWEVVGRRVRSADGGEVDLVALDPAGVLVGVEVKARRTPRAGAPIESVDAGRIGRMWRTLVATAATRRSPSDRPHDLRIDVVTAEPAAGRPGMWRLRRWPGMDAGSGISRRTSSRAR